MGYAEMPNTVEMIIVITFERVVTVDSSLSINVVAIRLRPKTSVYSRHHNQGNSKHNNLSHSGWRGWLRRVNGAVRDDLAISFVDGAIARDMPGLTAFIADLTGRVQWSSVGRRTIAGDMTLPEVRTC